MTSNEKNVITRCFLSDCKESAIRVTMQEDGSYELDEIFTNKAIAKWFDNKLFVSQNMGLKKPLRVVFNPTTTRTYLIPPKNFDHFIAKYFHTKELLNRDPELYCLLIPVPEVIIDDNHYFNSELAFNINISRLQTSTFARLDNAPIKISEYAGHFQEIFSDSFDYFIDLTSHYRQYLKEFFHLESDKINLNKLIKPYYKLSITEEEEIGKLKLREEDEWYKELDRDIEKENDRWQEREFDSYIDECNRIAFENDAENYWNID